jgi:CheY-like chemotaxis protein
VDVAAILISADGATGPVRALVDKLSEVEVGVTIAADIPTAVDLHATYAEPPCLVLDLTRAEIEEEGVTGAIRAAHDALPPAPPVALVSGADASLILECFRAGAGDVIDLEVESIAAARAAIERSCQRQVQHAQQQTVIETQRQMIEDLLKDLIQTERRSIDAEEQLAAQRRITGEHAPRVETRAPAILLVEHERAVADELADRLETAGITTFAYVTGEEAVREAETLAATTGLDLALVAVQLPGIDGLETVRRLRSKIAGLPAFLMTSVIDATLAATAANLGVVGFVDKPLVDLAEVVSRLGDLAHESLERTREQAYLQRIKERHERVLAQYRSLPREQ